MISLILWAQKPGRRTFIRWGRGHTIKQPMTISLLKIIQRIYEYNRGLDYPWYKFKEEDDTWLHLHIE